MFDSQGVTCVRLFISNSLLISQGSIFKEHELVLQSGPTFRGTLLSYCSRVQPSEGHSVIVLQSGPTFRGTLLSYCSRGLIFKETFSYCQLLAGCGFIPLTVVQFHPLKDH